MSKHEPKLTATQIDEIRASHAKGVHLARRLGVSEATISNIRNGKGWKLPPLPKNPTEEELFATVKKREAVRPEQIPAIAKRVPNSIFDLGRVL